MKKAELLEEYRRVVELLHEMFNDNNGHDHTFENCPADECVYAREVIRAASKVNANRNPVKGESDE